MATPLLTHLRQCSWWPAAIDRLRERVEQPDGGSLGTYADVYMGRRAAMVVDVVASRQRRYEAVVLRIVSDFDQRHPSVTLEELGESGPGGTRPTPREQETIQRAAAGLARFCAERGLDEDEGCRRWAQEAEPVRLAPSLDPYVGGKGIGIALFAYMRMRSGADAVKPDLRVRRAMRELGFENIVDDVALVLVVEAAAETLGVTPFQLDRVLWPAA